MKARIYRPAKTAMQSGKALTRKWRLEYDTADTRFVEPLMGWTGTRSTLGQINLRFDSKEAAIAYAEKHGIDYEVEEPQQPRPIRKSYADNFAYTRIR
ncbi:MAG TPA: ETC complex I subunit [Ferrovibrio sp.]|jgi:hypothetical protein|uniref:ETC complex I subunit n=1 Tax=Ferrovibrio sp. TaxID=1917215 RepID=UPI002B4AFC52|nr:ETC complex I subunit [Ferrovibrio sp.]HLT78086.1 ETC complex I subunit [Ferrovibrio sp.]